MSYAVDTVRWLVEDGFNVEEARHVIYDTLGIGDSVCQSCGVRFWALTRRRATCSQVCRQRIYRGNGH